ncbi:mitochondrial basic amino acids transporter-like [Oscarella lobularis]|uniref:mitochondrial basic amino acids transporter-like n=1 Tax=Oscarella lobularis TaxID=121494 RepID=UPI003313D749
MKDDFASGLLAGWLSVLALHPFDTIAVRMQTQVFGGQQYKGTVDCLATIIRQESAFALYKGFLPPLLVFGIHDSVAYGTYGTILDRLVETNAPFGASVFLAGIAAGSACAFIDTPMEMIKTRLQIEGKGRRRRRDERRVFATLDCARKLYAKHGLRRGIYRGFTAGFPHSLLYTSLSFLFFESFRARQSGGLGRVALAGGTAGVLSWILAHPLDVVKSRMQADDLARPAYRNVVDCARKSRGSLYCGLVPCLLRVFPEDAIFFAVVTMYYRYFAHRSS